MLLMYSTYVVKLQINCCDIIYYLYSVSIHFNGIYVTDAFGFDYLFVLLYSSFTMQKGITVYLRSSGHFSFLPHDAYTIHICMVRYML